MEDIYLSISQAAVRLPSFPLLCAWFCTCWAQAFPTCASHPGSIRATVWLSYCTSQALSAPCPGQHKATVCTIWFLKQSKAGWNLEGGCCHCPRSLGKGVLGTLPLDPAPRGAAQSPSAGHSAPSLFHFTVCREKKMLHWKRKKKKKRLRSQGHFNKHLT